MSEFYCFRADCECDLDIDEAYKQGRIDAIDEFMEVMEEWNKRVGFIRDECAFFTISNIRDVAEQIKIKY